MLCNPIVLCKFFDGGNRVFQVIRTKTDKTTAVIVLFSIIITLQDHSPRETVGSIAKYERGLAEVLYKTHA
jgi:hypothetical protein